DEHNDLFALIEGSLHAAPEARVDWIIEGLQHRDPKVCDTAMHCGDELCHERRGGPAALKTHFVRLVDDPAGDVPGRAVRALAGMGNEGIECLNRLRRDALPDVRAHVSEALERVWSRERERASWLTEERPRLLPPVSRLLKTISRHEGSRKWDDE